MTLKVGDKVRPLDLLKSIHFPDLSIVEVLELRGGRYSVLVGESGNYLNAVWAKPTELEVVEESTTFKVGDRVRIARSTVAPQWIGFEATVLPRYAGASALDKHKTWLKPEGKRPWGNGNFWWHTDSLEKVESVPFKLERGDRVVNRKTGREGFVANGRVWDTYNVRALPVPVKAIEEYEEWHPGTYDLIKKDAPW